jgi:hypothetical protein
VRTRDIWGSVSAVLHSGPGDGNEAKKAAYLRGALDGSVGAGRGGLGLPAPTMAPIMAKDIQACWRGVIVVMGVSFDRCAERDALGLQGLAPSWSSSRHRQPCRQRDFDARK